MEFQILAAAPGDGQMNITPRTFFNNLPVAFPDLARVVIHRPVPGQNTRQNLPVDLAAALAAGDTAHDTPLAWGDVLEIPETDHPLNENWTGFSTNQLAHLKQLLTRQISNIVKGQTNPVTLAPAITFQGQGRFTTVNITSRTPFWLGPVLLESKLVLTSSDLTRVKVSRRAPATGQIRAWTLDCIGLPRNQFNTPDLWLRDGDIIEIPEKP